MRTRKTRLVVKDSVVAIVKRESDDQTFTLSREIAKALGPSLIGAAKQTRADEIRTSMLNCTRDFMRQRQIMEQRLYEAQQRIDQIDARLKDIEAGNYSIDREFRIIFPHLPPPHIG
jgi:flagellar motility protein MotE (MotC chaperone)